MGMLRMMGGLPAHSLQKHMLCLVSDWGCEWPGERKEERGGGLESHGITKSWSIINCNFCMISGTKAFPGRQRQVNSDSATQINFF